MADPNDPDTLAWAAKFSNVPAAAPASSAPAGAADGGGDGSGDAQPPPNMTRISMDKVAQLDADISTDLLGGIDKAMAAMGDIFGLSALAKVDFRNPQAAAEAMKKHTRVSGADRDELKHLLAELGAAKHILDLALDGLSQQNIILRQSLDDLRNLPQQTDATVQAYKAADDLYEHVYDATIQVAKFALEIAENPASAILELVGTDVLKDLVKGGNSDELIGKLKSALADVGATTNQVISALAVSAAARVKDAVNFIQTRALPRVVTDAGSFEAANTAFQTRFDAVQKKAIQAGKNVATDPATASIVDLYKGIVAANKQYQEMQILVSKSKSLQDLGFWTSVLVPLGSRVKEDDRYNQATSVLYQKGGTIYCFFLPVAALRHSFEDLSAAVDKVQQLGKTDPKDIETICDGWMKAMVDAL